MTDTIRNLLFSEAEGNVYVVLDGASVPGLPDKLAEWEPPQECLYRGEIKPDVAEMAPYLVHLEPDAEFTAWILQKGWGNHWGIFAVSEADLATVRRHLRTLLVVHDGAGKPLYFRYYDPRVLRVYLPTCNGTELASMFGPVAAYLLEDEKPDKLLRFGLESGALDRQEYPVAMEKN
jgi:hypothetical protein